MKTQPNRNTFATRQPLFVWLIAGIITCCFCPAAGANQLTWTGGGADYNWGTAANWLDTNSLAVVPATGDDLIFTGSTRTTNICNLTAGIGFNSITYNNFLFLTAPTGTNGIMVTNGMIGIAASRGAGPTAPHLF